MKLLTSLAVLVSTAVAAVLPAEAITSLDERATADPACTNGPTTRACWSNGYSIATDFDQKSPRTGNTVTYNLEITNGTCNPDGKASRVCFLINGQFPGPLIRASWGDTVQVNVKNSLQMNGTAMHFHGVRQLNSCGADGVNGITQCPIAPGQQYTYSFIATQFGTSWYHSHFSNQYGDGVLGPMIFDGPASSNYDIDLGAYPVTDWYYQTAYQIASLASDNTQNFGGPPDGDNILVNGTAKAADGTTGKYSAVTMTKGKKYRLRLINVSVDNYINVSLDGHPFLVMTSDFVPIKPYSTNWLTMGIGQRYDVVITANQTAGNYWFRAEVNTACLSGNKGFGRGIFSYDSVSAGTPQSTAFASPSGCSEPTNILPFWTQAVPQGAFNSGAKTLDIGLTGAQVVPGGKTITVWALNGTSLDIDWRNPTLSYIFSGNTSYTQSMGVQIANSSPNGWNYWLIQQTANGPPIPHPIHLHGHDFFVLGQGTSQWDGTATLNYANPPRRDTATVYGGGWLAMAFQSNNPGAWLLHCHIAWHISEGLGMQFIERPSEMVKPDQGTYDGLCSSWDSYSNGMYWPKDDSGL
ncbi:hypothetical protein DOTSEDRAFT_129162 [Dothistroma septosporum NZE10]|uniref:laccase n=1 Tax=Dothistroma septosporum (strain NZE10 / CBS 128990) TaxID=675120 RepID=N1PQN6_DOTSN|nr:hypothetical protein DOTSEDRAFT_129162 [Dothistroma septosporum NZE10]